MSLILAIDQGTTGSTALLVDESLAIVGRGYAEFRQMYPEPGQVEHDLEDIWHSVRQAVRGALRGPDGTSSIDPARIRAIGLTNQRETVGFWRADRGATAQGHAIVWQDRRTADRCRALREEGFEDTVREKTGLLLDPYFSATKVEYRLNADAELRTACELGEVCVGTMDAYLAFRLTGGAAFVTDASNASRTLLFNIHTLRWDRELLAKFNVPEQCLPRVVGNADAVGVTRGLDFLPDGIPVCGMAGDQQAALFGQACFTPGDAKCTYGTGAFLLMNIGEHPKPSQHRLLTTVAWKLGATTHYALEGSAFIAGAAVQWLRDGLGFFDSAREVESLAASVPDAGGVVVVPAFTGLGAPHWRAEARGIIAGLTRGTTRAHIARATLEGIAHQVADLMAAMEADAGLPLSELKVDGGACANNLLMEMQANLADRTVVRPVNIETTAFGAAFLAGLGVGVWKSPEEIRAAWKEDRRFAPVMAADARAVSRSAWRRAVEAA